MASFDHIEIIEGKEIPFKIFIERRKSVRVSFGRSCINLRMPSSLSKSQHEKHFAKSVDWVRNHSLKNPDALTPYIPQDYDQLDKLYIYGEELSVDITYDERKTGKGGYDTLTKTILLVLPNGMSDQSKSKMIKQLLSRVCGQIFLPKIKERVFEINNKAFHKDIKSVNLKYNKSNWGSCSSATNINLSTRLLFAPFDVIDYVIVHELAHLYEMNHSQKFWNIVNQVMPNYKEKEQWLKKNGRLCDF